MEISSIIDLLAEEATDALVTKGHPKHMIVAPDISVYQHNGELFMFKIEERGEIWILTMTIKGFGDAHRIGEFATEEDAATALGLIQENECLNPDGSMNFFRLFEEGIEPADEVGREAEWVDDGEDDQYDHEWNDD